MDELSALPPEGSYRRSSRARTTSLNPRLTYTNPSPSTVRSSSPTNGLRINTAAAQSTETVIHAPTPRRHLLESSASQHWLNTPPLSPTSSRAVSPTSTVYPQSPALSSSQIRHRFATHKRSFSALLEHENRQGLRKPSSKIKLHEPEETSMGRRWIRWLHKRGLKNWVVPSLIGASTLVKFAVGLGTYSGKETPPMYGDYEAQRHWMELTLHLPFRRWYTYDLQYWGLDYPPLTAYVSWLCGLAAHWINPSWVALDDSRGIETADSKVFMRTTVITADALVYVVALLMFARVWQGTRSARTQELSLLTLLFQPALLLIDFGHFQYNSVMLGFTILAMNFFATGQDLLGAFFFVLSLGFKQMALYYAPAVGTYLLAKCIYLGPQHGGRLFIFLGLVTLGTFTLLFLPFLPPFASISDIKQPFIRIFPFARGLFEDKVANFWCATNVVFKWKAWMSRTSLVRLSGSLTAVGFLPAVLGLLTVAIKLRGSKPSGKEVDSTKKPEQTPFLPLLPYALLTSSMSFFLFSFQVHEKTILLPLLPLTLLLSGATVDSAVFSWGALANNVAVFSMWPLLKRDGLGIQYITLLFLWNRLIGYNPFKARPNSFIQLLSMAVYCAAIGLHMLELVITPPARYPDLFPVLNVLISAPVFVLVWLWSIKSGMEVGWALGGLGTGKSKARVEQTQIPEVAGSFRQSGGRSISLGYGQAKRGQLNAQRSRASSLAPE